MRKFCDQQISPLNAGEIAMVMSDVPNGKALAKCYLIERSSLYTLNQRICSLKPTETISKFLFFLLNRNRYFLEFDSKVTQTNLRKDEVLSCPLRFPHKKEQQKIATFLSSVGFRIEQLGKKKALLEKYKKGMTQKLFGQEIRFKDEKGKEYPNWKRKKISDIGYFYYGKSAPKFSVSKDAQTPCVRYGELYSTYEVVITEIKSRTNIDPSTLKFSKGGEILVPRVGENPLDFARCSYLPIARVAIGEMISVFNTKENPLFYTYYFNSLKKAFARMVEGGNVSNLYFRYLEPIEIFKPALEEQQKIADFLSAIDRKIELVATELKKAQTFKKGLLQQMFI